MSKTSFPLVGVALDSPVKPKKNRTPTLKAAKAKIRRVVQRSPEVIVKVTGACQGKAQLKSHMDYISRNGKIDLENERGEDIDNKDRLREEHRDWARELGKPRKNERDSIHIVLSMPMGTDPEAVKTAARNFAKEQFGENHRYLMALHHSGNDKDTKNPHVHLTVKSLGFDGTRLDAKKADLQEWREAFAEKMLQQGWDAEATPRRTRGIIEKSLSQAVYALERRAGRPGSTVQAAKLKEAAADLKGESTPQNPFRQKIIERQNAVRRAWLEGAVELERSHDPDDRKLALQIREFVKTLPVSLEDERIRIKKVLLETVEEQRKRVEQSVLAAKAGSKDIDSGRD